MAKTKDEELLYREQVNRGTKIKSLTYGGLMIALVFISTYAIRIPVPFTQGYIHPGDSMIFVAALLFGWRFGAVAGGLGSALADLLGGYAHWALPTLIIKGIMGALVGWLGYDLLKKDKSSRLSNFVALGGTVLWLIFCYGIRVGMSNALFQDPNYLAEQVSPGSTMAQLNSLVQGVDFWLTVAALALPAGMAIIVYYLRKYNQELFHSLQLIGVFLGGLWMIIGYYIGAGFLYGSFIIPIFSVPSNIIQFLGGLGIAYLILAAIKKSGLDGHF